MTKFDWKYLILGDLLDSSFFPETRDVQGVNFLFGLQADMNLRASMNSSSDYIYH